MINLLIVHQLLKENKQLKLPSYVIRHDDIKYDDIQRVIAEAKVTDNYTIVNRIIIIHTK